MLARNVEQTKRRPAPDDRRGRGIERLSVAYSNGHHPLRGGFEGRLSINMGNRNREVAIGCGACARSRSCLRSRWKHLHGCRAKRPRGGPSNQRSAKDSKLTHVSPFIEKPKAPSALGRHAPEHKHRAILTCLLGIIPELRIAAPKTAQDAVLARSVRFSCSYPPFPYLQVGETGPRPPLNLPGIRIVVFLDRKQ